MARHNLDNAEGLPAIPFEAGSSEQGAGTRELPTPRSLLPVPGSDLYDVAGQRQRAQAFLDQFNAARQELFDDHGRWHGAASDKPIRGLELGSYLVPFLRSGNPKLIAAANGIYEHADENWRGLFAADSYQPLPEILALMRCRGQLTPTAAAKMEAICRQMCEHYFLQDRWEFQGDNDNFPLTANACLAAWGTLTKNPKLIELARGRYEQFAGAAFPPRVGFGVQ